MSSVESSNVIETSVDSTTVSNEEQVKQVRELYQEGKDLYNAGKLDEASEKLSDALKLNVESFEGMEEVKFGIHYFYGKSLLNKIVPGDASSGAPAREAFEAAQKIVDAHEGNKDWGLENARLSFASGEQFVKEEKYTEAVEKFTKSSELYTTYGEAGSEQLVAAQIALGDAYKFEKNFSKAQEIYTQVKDTIAARADDTEEKKAENLERIEELKTKIAELELETKTPEVESTTEVEATPEVETATEVEATPEVESTTEVEAAPETETTTEVETVEVVPETEQADENATGEVIEIGGKTDSDNVARQGIKRNAETVGTDESKRLKEINNE